MHLQLITKLCISKANILTFLSPPTEGDLLFHATMVCQLFCTHKINEVLRDVQNHPKSDLVFKQDNFQ